MSLVTPLAWDTEFFGLSIGRLDIPGPALSPEAIEEGFRQAHFQKIACLYFEIPFPESGILSSCQRPGFYMVDLKTTLDKALGREEAAEEKEGLLDFPRPEHYPALQTIVEDLALRSRFRYDPHFGERESKRLYREWLRKSFYENTCSDFIVFLSRDKLEGFLTTKMKENIPSIDLLGVARQAQGRGIGGRLIRAAQHRLIRRGHDRLSVVTQGHNIPALRAYEKNGFLVRSVNIFYHVWLGELAP